MNDDLTKKLFFVLFDFHFLKFIHHVWKRHKRETTGKIERTSYVEFGKRSC
ncbi:hypothetical protein T10_3476 [Trichinella papuae]|uniref:Uncharacterized protein n=1 Tax=Trichinella papuae TaxID=268474 RepID=A0A0V1N412_9BILA|nr:hypothetical protein T10_3476 [Trichinella papuae]